jgi:hypothetical protein
MQPTNEPLGEPRRRKIPLAAWIAIGVCGALLVTCGVGGWMLARSERGRKIINASREVAAMAQDASDSPAAEALRELGCDQAAVFSAEQMRALAGAFVEEEEHLEEIDRIIPEDTTSVHCRMGLFTSDEDMPSCSAVAQTYAEATGVSAPFWVVVQKGSAQSGCSGKYSPQGEWLEGLPGQATGH